MEPIVGIDLGTTNSEVAFIIDEHAEILKDNDNGIMPSCVSLDHNGKIIVGTEAKNQAVIAPDRTVLSVKRLMGSDERISIGEETYRPQEISAFILKALKQRAEKSINKPVGKAVITVPAYFTDAQRHATREAGEIAGLEVIRIINEPTAAALAYESTRSETRRILIFDLGGGTFDVSIVKIEQGIVEVLSSTGDNRLGGDDFDLKIRDRLAEHCETELKLPVSEDKTIMARLLRAAEQAKISLSYEPFTRIEEDHIGKKMLKAVHLSYELSRMDFNEMIDDELSRTMDSVSKALKDADLLPSDIDRIILVGGSTRIPAISDMLEKKFGKSPHSEIDPDLCVAMGAAIQAGREMGLDHTGILLDVTPYTFGTSALGQVNGMLTDTMFVPIIRRNSKLPAARTEAFATVYDNQERVDFSVYQGEKPNAVDNILIGTYNFDLTKAPRGSVLLLNYSLDINGILKLEATEKETGRKINAVIENAFAEYSEEAVAESKQRIASMWGEEDTASEEETADETEEAAPAGSEKSDLPADILALVEQAEKKLPEIPEEDRDEMVNLLEDIRDAASKKDNEELNGLQEALEDFLFYLD